MVKEIRLGASKVKQGSEIAYSILGTVALAIGAAKLATQPQVRTSLGSLPLWQVVAGVLLAILACKLWKLHSNER